MVQLRDGREWIGSDLAHQRGEVAVEALAQHQSVAKRQADDEGLHDRASRWLDAEKAADVAAMPGRLANVAIVGDLAPLALAAPHLDVEGRPPVPVMGGGTLVAEPALASGEVVEPALGMEHGQGAFEVMGVLRLEMASDQGQKVGGHDRVPVLYSSSYKI
jgi:hypothetical protein